MAAQRGGPADEGIDDEHVVDDEFLPVRVRSSPRYGRFLGAGIVLGLVLAATMTFLSGPPTNEAVAAGMPEVMRVFGVSAAICVAAGLLVSGSLALVLDHVVSKRARLARAEHVTMLVVDMDAPVRDERPPWLRDADEPS